MDCAVWTFLAEKELQSAGQTRTQRRNESAAGTRRPARRWRARWPDRRRNTCRRWTYQAARSSNKGYGRPCGKFAAASHGAMGGWRTRLDNPKRSVPLARRAEPIPFRYLSPVIVSWLRAIGWEDSPEG